MKKLKLREALLLFQNQLLKLQTETDKALCKASQDDESDECSELNYIEEDDYIVGQCLSHVELLLDDLGKARKNELIQMNRKWKNNKL